jgi:hypothetical protein
MTEAAILLDVRNASQERPHYEQVPSHRPAGPNMDSPLFRRLSWYHSKYMTTWLEINKKSTQQPLNQRIYTQRSVVELPILRAV